MTLERKRVIRESTRKKTSTSYKIDLKNRKPEDDVHVVITHESMPSFREERLFKANQLQGKKSIHFKWDGEKVRWYGLEISPTATANTKCINQKSKNISKRDEDYVIDLCDITLGYKALRQHRFDFLCGDTGSKLPVDAYYKELNLVVEYYEKQHTESVEIFDNKMTASGVLRGEQRRKYDERRKKVLPQHGINVITISYSDFKFDGRKKIVRNEEDDSKFIRLKLKEYLK